MLKVNQNFEKNIILKIDALKFMNFKNKIETLNIKFQDIKR